MKIDLPASAKKLLLRVISVIMLMEMLDATVLNTALPQIARSLHVNPVSLKEILTVYYLSLGIFIPVSGWVADRFGEKNSMLFAIVLFTVSSLACGLSINLPMLVSFRLLQGIGGAFLMPIGRQILVRVYPRFERIKAMASINTVTLLALLMGPVVGGALTTYANWRWIFFINIPIGALGFLLIDRYLPIIRERTKSRFDLLGFILIGLALGSMLFLLDVIIDVRISIFWKIALLLISVFSIILYMPHAKRTESPLISLSLFRQGEFTPVILGSFFTRLTSATQPFLVPLLLQTGYGYSAFKSGLFQLPVIFSTLISMRCISYLARRYDNQKLLITATILFIIGFCSFSYQAFNLLPWLLILQQIFIGLISPVQTSLMNSQAYENLTPAYLSQGTSVYSGIIQVSGSFGIALTALVIISIIGPSDLSHDVPLVAFKVVFLVQSLYSVLALIIFSRLSPLKE